MTDIRAAARMFAEGTMTEFRKRVYETVRRIPEGRVATYGQIAALLGVLGGARAVGNALHDNPYPGQVPCHRVVNAQGKTADHFGFGGHEEQRRRLREEGVPFLDERHVDLSRCRWNGE